MKSLDYAGFVETLRLLATVIPANMSKQYSFLIPDEIEVENELDVQQYITDNYYVSNDGLTSNIIQSKVPNIAVTPGTWTYNDETTFYENNAQIQITFPDNSKLSKNVKVFYREITEYEVPEGLRLDGDYIDTGLTLDGRYTIETTGYSNGLSTGAMVGAYENNNLRTTLRILPVSGKMQAMWYKNNEILKSELGSAGVNILSEFTYIQTASNVKIYQNGELKLDKAISSGDATQTSSVPICIFNEVTSNGTYNNCIVKQVKIYDESNNLIRDMRAYRYNGTYVFKDFVSGNMYSPNSGELVLP